jgi:hypothetical protein
MERLSQRARWCEMAHYYFDLQDDEGLVPDDIGLEFDTLEKAKTEAARALTEMARDQVGGPKRLVLVVKVRNEHKRPLLEVRLILEFVQPIVT